jgi:hypothetical protein
LLFLKVRDRVYGFVFRLHAIFADFLGSGYLHMLLLIVVW